MGIISRGIKNTFRNIIRTISITLILAISIGLVLVMLLAHQTVQGKINDVKGSVGNTITVSPAGVRGFEGGGELLTDSDVNTISSIPHVSKTDQTLSDRLTNGQNTSLQASLEPGSFGRRRQGEEQQPSENQPGENRPTNFTMPVNVTGTNNLSSDQSLNINQLKITSGSAFDAGADSNLALLGTDLAAKNNLKTGSIFSAYNTNVTVSGIFDSGNRFSNSSLYMPLKAVQRLSGQSGQVSNIVVQVDSIDNVSSVQSAIKTQLGSKADVVSAQDASSESLQPLENIKTISLYSLIGALIAGAVIIFLTMMMIVRERRKEIGVLKAIGASNIKVTLQFIVESLVLTLMGGVLGVIFGFIFSNPIIRALVSNSTSTATRGPQGGPGGGRGMGIAMRLGGALPNVQNNLRNIQAVIGWNIIIYGILIAIVIAILGSAIPAFLISKIRPAEVMRSE
jgi:putative ABC transport system permease protein